MEFRDAFKIMKSGGKVKLQSWGGYWFWDNDKTTIIMHTKDGEDIDIRETKCPEYTFGNITSDEWMIADEENCPELGGAAYFDFSNAIKYLKRGLKVARKGWNGKKQYIYDVDSMEELKTMFETIINTDFCTNLIQSLIYESMRQSRKDKSEN